MALEASVMKNNSILLDVLGQSKTKMAKDSQNEFDCWHGNIQCENFCIYPVYAIPKATCIPEWGLWVLLECKHDNCIHQITYHTAISYNMVSNEHHHVNFKVVHIKIFYVHLSFPEQLLLTRYTLYLISKRYRMSKDNSRDPRISCDVCVFL